MTVKTDLDLYLIFRKLWSKSCMKVITETRTHSVYLINNKLFL